MSPATNNDVMPLGTAGDTLASKGSSVIHAISPKESVYEAVDKMNQARVGALLVMDEKENLVGVISERDYTRKIVLLGRSSKETLVEQIMSSPVITVDPATPMADCMKIVTDRRIRHLPVVESGRVVGVLSIGDLIRCVIAQQAETIGRLSRFIAGDYPS